MIGIFLFPCPAMLHAQGVPGGLPASGAVASDPATQQIGSALSLLRLGSIEEARQCVAVLEAAQNQNPGIPEFGDVRNLIMSLFRAEAAVVASRKALVEANARAGQLQRNAKMASEVSPLTGRSNSDQAGRYRDQASQLISEANGSLQQSQALLVNALVDARARLVEKYPGVPRDFIQRIADRNEVELPVLSKMEGKLAGEIQEFGGIEFVWCPPGEFLMGSPEDEAGRNDDEKQHLVRLTRGFWMAKTECTQIQWERVMGQNPSRFTGANLPVEMVSWDDVQGWLRGINEALPLPEGFKWSLPTEAQWEYACRAGTEGEFSGDFEEMAWYSSNSGSKSNPVGSKKANAWGIHDMHGNVWEWCADWYWEYGNGPATDPTAPRAGFMRVTRGGSGNDSPGTCRSAFRAGRAPEDVLGVLGFRPAIVPTN